MRPAAIAAVLVFVCLAGGILAQVSNIVELNSIRYATIDNIQPDSETPEGQLSSFPVPAGWSVATNDDNSRAAAAARNWGSDCLVVSDGGLVPTRIGGQCSSGFVVAADGRVRALAKRIMIQQFKPQITSVTPSSGPLTGGTLVTVAGRNLGTGSDIVSVIVSNVQATIVSQTADSVVVATRPASVPGDGTVRVFSNSNGETVSAPGAFTYGNQPAPVERQITGVAPTSGPLTGGTVLTVSGRNLGNGADITSVTVSDVPATIVSQTVNSVVVTTGAASTPGNGVVRVVSASNGETVSAANLFTYTPNAPPPALTVQPASAAWVARTLITITGTNIGSGSDITAVLLGGAQTEIVSQTANQVVVRTLVAAHGSDVVVQSTSRGSVTRQNVFTFLPPPVIDSVFPASGPLAGNNLVTVKGSRLGNGNDIDAVIFGNATGTIVSQTASQVVVRAPESPLGAGVVSVQVNSASTGFSRLTLAYEYAPVPYVDPFCPCSRALLSIKQADGSTPCAGSCSLDIYS